MRRLSPGARASLLALAILLAALPALEGCSRREPPSAGPARGRDRAAREQVGFASWYGPKFHGRTTASGKRYNMFDMTAAHRDLPFGSRVRVTNMENGRQVLVTINDRGPFVKGRIIDLSYAAARELDMTKAGTARVRLEVLSLGGG